MENHDIYLLVRMNLLNAFKGSYFIDSPNRVVHKIDSLYCRLHNHEHSLFLRLLKTTLMEMEDDFSMDVEEFHKVRENLKGLNKFLESKLQMAEEAA